MCGKACQPDQRHPDTKGKRGEGRDCGDVVCVKPKRRVDAVSHRATRDGVQPDRVAEGIAEESTQCDDPQGKGFSEIPKG